MRRVLVCLLLSAAAPLRAQTIEVLPGRFEASVGAAWNGRIPFGSRNATETTGTGDAFRLFTTATELGAAPSIDGRFSVRVLPRLEAEVHGSFASPELRSTITFDAETGATPVSIADTVQHFVIAADALWYLSVPRLGGRTRLFVAGGVGYLRQLEDRGTVIVSAPTVDIGGGAKIVLRSRSSGLTALGARLDARAVVRGSAVAIDGRSHVSPSVGASLFVRF